MMKHRVHPRYLVGTASILALAGLFGACGDTANCASVAAPDSGKTQPYSEPVEESDASSGEDSEVESGEPVVFDAGADTRFQSDGEALDGALFPDTNVDGAPQYDAGPPDPYKFTDQIEGTYCARLGGCCLALNYTTTFDNAACVDSLENNPFPYGVFGIPTLYKSALPRGHMVFDTLEGQICLDLLETFSCAQFGSADWVELNKHCVASFLGTIPVGSTGCASAVECVQPAACDLSGGGPTGTCVALNQSGAPCSDNSQCGDALTGIARYCSNIETYPAAPTGVCKDQKAVGQECGGFPQECVSQLCELDETSSTYFRCASTSSFTASYVCESLK